MTTRETRFAVGGTVGLIVGVFGLAVAHEASRPDPDTKLALEDPTPVAEPSASVA